ncbi:uncharacterized protein SAPINGB_P004415 [Magnusiomyces paraingens]|uniref:DNA replication complex GINS protein PSF3 n=1 Tax=Magnusiomyces paraingens TaxID=2606893 RepID=A0A5E8BUD1_9ASCO|nr:uncharacterized protein SAPINGB_P004415 [Saprochaete ingens]VVT55076.1 unnamed protein product [Saprochaete ingens]
MYYDLDDIAKDQQTLPCKFNVTVPNLGYLVGAPGTEMKKDATVDLPVWLLRILAQTPIAPDSTTPFVTPLPTKEFAARVLNALKSDPSSVDLRLLSPVFFRLAEQWLTLMDAPELASVLIESFKNRAAEIADLATAKTTRDASEFLQRLDSTESRLYRSTHEANKDLKTWLATNQL